MSKQKTTPNEVELEEKSMLTAEQFDNLYVGLGLTQGHRKEQRNMYFLDKQGVIQRDLPPGTTLRARLKKGSYQLEFKIPLEEKGTDEYGKGDPSFKENDQLYTSLFVSGIVFSGEVRDALVRYRVDPFNVQYVGSCVTNRYVLDSKPKSVDEEDWRFVKEVCLDETTYPDAFTDFELEVESDSIERSTKVLQAILNQFSIERVNGLKKIQRFYEHMVTQ